LFHPAALEGDLGIFGDIEKLAAEMIVPFRNAGVDARRVDRYANRRLFRMLRFNSIVPLNFLK
jgi:hypothetical protein